MYNNLFSLTFHAVKQMKAIDSNIHNKTNKNISLAISSSQGQTWENTWTQVIVDNLNHKILNAQEFKLAPMQKQAEKQAEFKRNQMESNLEIQGDQMAALLVAEANGSVGMKASSV